MPPFFHTKYSIRVTLGKFDNSPKIIFSLKAFTFYGSNSIHLKKYFLIEEVSFTNLPYTTQLLGLNFIGFSRPYLRYRTFCFLFLLLIRYFSSERSLSILLHRAPLKWTVIWFRF